MTYITMTQGKLIGIMGAVLALVMGWIVATVVGNQTRFVDRQDELVTRLIILEVMVQDISDRCNDD